VFDCDENGTYFWDCTGACVLVEDFAPVDECGECEGDGYAADCTGTDNCQDMDCAGVCFGDAEVASNGDCCDNLFLCANSIDIYVCLTNQIDSLEDCEELTGCMDDAACNYDPTALIDDENNCAYTDMCGTCDNDSSNDCTQDCAGYWGGPDNDPLTGDDIVEDTCGVCGGTGYFDNCNICDDDPNNDCIQDCAGEWGGSAAVDDCSECNDNPADDCTQDCAGEWGGTTIEDLCGVCGGAGYFDNCNICDDDTSNDCVQDCAGVWGGEAYFDNCGECNDNPADDCTQDCAGLSLHSLQLSSYAIPPHSPAQSCIQSLLGLSSHILQLSKYPVPPQTPHVSSTISSPVKGSLSGPPQ
jgi:hypothetical protein